MHVRITGRGRGFIAAMLAVSLAAATGCGAARGDFVWASDVEESAERDAFMLQSGDVVHVDVWKQEELSGSIRVRSDGRITVPLVGDVRVSGLTPSEAAGTISESLSEIVREPRVSVSVEEIQPVEIGVLGEVESPGMYAVDRGAGMLHALAQAGGLSEYASSDGIYLVRGGWSGGDAERRIRFRYDELVAGRDRAPRIVLEHGDVIVVE